MMTAMLATPATKMARKSSGRCATFARTRSRRDLVARVRRATSASLDAEPCVAMVFGAVGRLRCNDPQDRVLTVLPAAALVCRFIPSTRLGQACGFQKTMANSRRKLIEQGLGLDEIERLQPLRKPAIDWSATRGGFLTLPLMARDPTFPTS
jgi:hypothetical protein